MNNKSWVSDIRLNFRTVGIVVSACVWALLVYLSCKTTISNVLSLMPLTVILEDKPTFYWALDQIARGFVRDQLGYFGIINATIFLLWYERYMFLYTGKNYQRKMYRRLLTIAVIFVLGFGADTAYHQLRWIVREVIYLSDLITGAPLDHLFGYDTLSIFGRIKLFMTVYFREWLEVEQHFVYPYILIIWATVSTGWIYRRYRTASI